MECKSLEGIFNGECFGRMQSRTPNWSGNLLRLFEKLDSEMLKVSEYILGSAFKHYFIMNTKFEIIEVII